MGSCSSPRKSFHFSPALAGEFCFAATCPFQPPSIFPTSSIGTDKAMYFLSSIPLASIKERLGAIDFQLAKMKEEGSNIGSFEIPNKKEVEAFAKEASVRLRDLSFSLRREIVLSTVDKVVGNREKLQVYGYIPINHVGFKTICRDCGPA